MATKVKPTAKTEVKPKVDAKAKEAQAAAIAKAIEKAVPSIVAVIQANVDAEAKVSTTFLEMCDVIRDKAETLGFDREATTLLVKTALCEQFNDGKPAKEHVEPAKVGSHPVLKFKLSKIVNLASPKDKDIAKQIDLAREKGVPITQLHRVATGSMKASEAAKSLGRGGDTKKKSEEKQKNGAKVIEDADEFSNQFAGLVGRAIAGGLDDKDILTAAIETIAGAIFKRDEAIDEDGFSEQVQEATTTALAVAQA